MRKLSVLLVALLLGLSGCGAGPAATKPYVDTDGYPLDICVVTGEKLGTMGDPYVIKFEGKTVKLCCSSCVKNFNKDTAKYMSTLEEAEKKKNPGK